MRHHMGLRGPAHLVPYALIGAIVGELIASNRGPGFLLANASGQIDTAGVLPR
jgi:ABC-type nitrate/sulfonate/bicarbonate transport system permease component